MRLLLGLLLGFFLFGFKPSFVIEGKINERIERNIEIEKVKQCFFEEAIQIEKYCKSYEQHLNLKHVEICVEEYCGAIKDNPIMKECDLDKSFFNFIKRELRVSQIYNSPEFFDTCINSYENMFIRSDILKELRN